MPATAFEARLDEEREYLLWKELEKRAMSKYDEQMRSERALICIYCGKVCDDEVALEAHEEQCA
jgi:hypothetical protein